MVFHVDYEHNVRNSAQTKAAGLCNVITAFGYVRVEGGGNQDPQYRIDLLYCNLP